VSRNWDRSPETPADTRFHNLRETGYRGPIDQDGRAVADPDMWIDAQLHPQQNGERLP
jgi:hypothetical protein